MNGKKIKSTIKKLKGHNPIIFGTDTINGIGCMHDDIKGIKKIFELKKRNKEKPLVLLFSDLKMVEKYVFLNDIEKRMIRKYMPGALTLIVCSKRRLNGLLMKNNKIAIRIPGRRSLRDLIKCIQKPLASTSLNLSENQIVTNRKEIKNHFPNISVYNNITTKALPSTIIEIRNGSINIIRKGKLNVRGLSGKN